MSIFLKWGVPAFVTVVGGTAAAIATSGAAMPPDLTARASAAIADANWAEVSFDARDATLTGTATTQRMIDDAVARVAAVHGVRSVTAKVVLAEYASPFPFVASIAGGTIRLAGGLPDEDARAPILAAAGAGTTDAMRPMSGGPGRATWVAAVDYALGYARELDEGEVALADLTLTVSGRAKSPESYAALQRLAAAPAPAGVVLAFHEFTPPLHSPYEWRAEYDGKRLILSGAAPSGEVANALEALAPSGKPVSTSMVVASGAPSGFEARATHLVQNLLKLERGSATISGTTSTLSGSPADPATAEAIRVAMTPGGTTVMLGPPQVQQYWFSAERGATGIILDGFVPDEALRDRLEAMDGVDAAGLELGRGAPERFESGVDFIVEALGHMSEGRGSLAGTAISLSGRATTAAEFTRLETTLDLGAPQGLILAGTYIRPPLATPFTFAAEKTAGGAFAVSGHVPSEAVRKAVLAALPGAAADSTTIADGNPADFRDAAIKAVGVLALLDTGKVAYDGASWSLTGTVDSPTKAFAAESAFATAGLRAAGWSYAVALPAASTPAALPVIDPYAWRAQKLAGGGVTFSGFVPTPQLKSYLAVHAGQGVTDGSALGAGAPDGFIGDAIAALDALLALDEGSVSLSAGSWSLDGKIRTSADRHAVESQLRRAADTSRWHVAIQAADAAPVVAPFVWSATKAADGAVTLAGYVPTESLRAALAAAGGTGVVDRTLVGSGEPRGFDADAGAGLAALLKLETGELRYDGTRWSISGQPKSPAEADAVTAAVAAMSDGGASWTAALAAPLEAAPVAQETVATDPATNAASDQAVTVEPATPAADDAQPVPAEPAQPAADAETAVAAIEPAAETPTPPAVRDYVFDARKVLGGPVTFAGAVPAEPMRRYLAVITGTEPAEGLSISDSLPEGFIPSAEAGSRALKLLADGEFGLDGDTWVFSGRAETEAQKQAALAELAAAPQADRWQTSVTLLPPLLVCKDKVGAFAARNAILFQSGSARIAAESLPAIDELAADLALCPEATVEVEGHTDADGDDAANLALSVSRAEAVVDALVERGVAADRLYAIGYGESLPVASNETKAGKQANRRIAFTLSDE
ncbi:OmpA family protein [Devosia sp.]|uniref:OmpA family protein n=1 Tax=Devosia sp. TaxID=1871048 RepID=UPI001AC93483|nr:OmpA family protein [Devosia sp.]MBN9309378.1 OmpA family protein [Devosia sp.]